MLGGNMEIFLIIVFIIYLLYLSGNSSTKTPPTYVSPKSSNRYNHSYQIKESTNNVIKSSRFNKNSTLAEVSKYLQSLEKAYSTNESYEISEGHFTFVRLAGTTYYNRQHNISTVKENYKLRLENHGKNGIICFFSNRSLGVIPSEKTAYIKNLIENDKIESTKVESIRGGSLGKNYGIIIRLKLNY